MVALSWIKKLIFCDENVEVVEKIVYISNCHNTFCLSGGVVVATLPGLRPVLRNICLCGQKSMYIPFKIWHRNFGHFR